MCMSFYNTAPCFLTFYRSDQSLLPFKFKIFVLNTSLNKSLTGLNYVHIARSCCLVHTSTGQFQYIRVIIGQ